jgi:hypothetical protein
MVRPQVVGFLGYDSFKAPDEFYPKAVKRNLRLLAVCTVEKC